MRELIAYINAQPVGKLVDDNGIWSFAYDPQWLASSAPYPLNAVLTLRAEPHVDSSSNRPVQWYFDNLLPEESARALLAKDANLDNNDAFSLLAYYGAESAGSLVLSDQDPARIGSGEQILPDAELQKRIGMLPTISLAAGAPKRMSLAGAQHKLAVIYRSPELYEPIGALPSTHILKPNHGSKDFCDSVVNEFFTMRLAHAVGLVVPAVFRKYVPAPIYLIARFDRVVTGNRNIERLHAIDACQLLNLDRQYKYREASIKRLADIAAACNARAPTRLLLFRWFVFNLLVGNDDAHLKNLSFLVDAQGIRLAPHYDMISTAAYHTRAIGNDLWPNIPLSWSFQGCERFSEIGRSHVIAAGVELGISADTSRRLLDTQLKALPVAAQKLLAEIEADNMVRLEENKDLAATFSSEMRTLRTIASIIMTEMVARLSKG